MYWVTMTVSQPYFGFFGLEVKSFVWKGIILEHHDGVKRVECRRGEVDYGYLAAHGVKRV